MINLLTPLLGTTGLPYVEHKIKLLLFFCLSFAVQSNAQTWTQLSPPNPPIAGAILGIHFVDDQTGYISGANGAISKTLDCGKTWQSQISGTTSTLYSIFFTDASHGVAVGSTGTIRITTNGGLNWVSPTTVPAAATTTDFRVVWFDAVGNGYIGGGVAGTYSQILKTTNGGTTWTDISPAQTFAAGATGRAIYGIFFTSPTVGYATDFDGRILKTVNSGGIWTATQATLVSNNLHGIYFTSALRGFAVGGDPSTATGVILKTEDAGLNWTSTQLPVGSFLTDVKFNSSGGAYAVGGNPVTNTQGVIYKPLNITTGFNSWGLETTGLGSFSRLFRLSVPSSTTVYCSGLNGTLLKTPFIDATFTLATLSNGGCFDFQFNNTGSSTLTYSWNFNDPSSGANNTSAQQNPVHQFSKCGTFNVCLTVTGGGCSTTTCQTITIVDNIPPSITNCPQNQTVGTDPGQCYHTLVAPWNIIATDNCDPNPSVTLTYTDPAGVVKPFTASTTMPKGINTFVYVAKDKCGNMSRQCAFTITVMDTEAPKIICPLSSSVIGTLTPAPAQCKAIVKGLAPTVADNCPMVNVTYAITGATTGSGVTDVSGTSFMQGISTVTYTATDMGGNTATCSFTVTVKCDPCKPNLALNLSGYFPFNGNANDVSPNLLHGTATNVIQATAISGLPSAFSFNGTNSWIDCGNSNRGVTDAVAVCAWVKTTEKTKGMWVAGQYLNGGQPKGYLLSIGDVTNSNIGLATFSGRVDASAYYTATSNSSIKVNDGQWHCLVGTAGNGEWKIYVDGILRGSQPGLTTPSIALLSNGPQFTIGTASVGANPMWYNGAMDDVRVYNRVLNECEIEALCKTNIVSGLGEVRNKIQLSVYPNPNSGNFNVELPQSATTGMSLRVTDLAGRLVLEKQTQTGDILQTVQAENLPGGMYLLQVIEKGRIVGVEKFVKQ